jgi:hypothetical protein
MRLLIKYSVKNKYHNISSYIINDIINNDPFNGGGDNK